MCVVLLGSILGWARKSCAPVPPCLSPALRCRCRCGIVQHRAQVLRVWPPLLRTSRTHSTAQHARRHVAPRTRSPPPSQRLLLPALPLAFSRPPSAVARSCPCPRPTRSSGALTRSGWRRSARSAAPRRRRGRAAARILLCGTAWLTARGRSPLHALSAFLLAGPPVLRWLRAQEASCSACAPPAQTKASRR